MTPAEQFPTTFTLNEVEKRRPVPEIYLDLCRLMHCLPNRHGNYSDLAKELMYSSTRFKPNSQIEIGYLWKCIMEAGGDVRLQRVLLWLVTNLPQYTWLRRMLEVATRNGSMGMLMNYVISGPEAIDRLRRLLRIKKYQKAMLMAYKRELGKQRAPVQKKFRLSRIELRGWFLSAELSEEFRQKVAAEGLEMEDVVGDLIENWCKERRTA